MWQHAPERPLVLSHIPKTAGTSLRVAIQEALGLERVFVGLDHSTFGAFDDFDDLSDSVRSTIVDNPADLPDDAEFITGHVAPSTTLSRFPDALHLTVLREPRTRLLSYWMFSRAHTDFMLRRWGGYGDAIRAARTDLGSYLADPSVAAHSDNGMVRFLLWPHPLVPSTGFISESDDEHILGDVLERLDSFTFTGAVEAPDLIGSLGAALGCELQPRRLNESPRTPRALQIRLDDALSPGAAELLGHRNRIDTRVWSHVIEKTMPDADPATLSDHTLGEAMKRYSGGTRPPPIGARFADAGYRLLARKRLRR